VACKEQGVEGRTGLPPRSATRVEMTLGGMVILSTLMGYLQELVVLTNAGTIKQELTCLPQGGYGKNMSMYISFG